MRVFSSLKGVSFSAAFGVAIGVAIGLIVGSTGGLYWVTSGALNNALLSADEVVAASKQSSCIEDGIKSSVDAKYPMTQSSLRVLEKECAYSRALAEQKEALKQVRPVEQKVANK